jgi:hypothetical protein
MHLGTYFEIQVLQSTFHSSTQYSYKYMKLTHQLQLLYFEVDKGITCMDIAQNFHIIVRSIKV